MRREFYSALSRRGFLAAGAATGLVALAGSALAIRMTRSEAVYRSLAGPGPAPEVLNWKALAVLTLVADTIVSPNMGSPSVIETMTARRIDRELSFAGTALREDMRAALAYLEVRPALSGTLTPFSSLEPDARLRLLLKMRAAPGTDRDVFSGLKFFSGFFYYTDDRTWPSIGYAGPAFPESKFEAGNRIANLSNPDGGSSP